MTNTSYQAASTSLISDLPTARNLLDFETIQPLLQKRGDAIKVAQQLRVNTAVFSRFIAEKQILPLFPNLEKSKIPALSSIKNGRELLLFTQNHNPYTLSARQLGKAVKQWKNRVEQNSQIILTDLQQDLIIGSLLGDASIRQRDKNCLFRVGHTQRQEEYLKWKYNILEEFTISKPAWNTRHFNEHTVRILELATTTHYAFNYYRRLFYKNGRKQITRDILNLLNPQSLAIWVCDDGSYSRTQGYIILCTNAFSFEEHVIMKKYFEEVWGISPTIGFRDKKYYYLRFKQEDTKRLVQIIKPFILKSMKYKIGADHESGIHSN